MKIPKYIEMALKRRSNAACSFARNDYIISKFIKKHGLEDKVKSIDHNWFGVEAFIERDDCCGRIRRAIIDKE